MKKIKTLDKILLGTLFSILIFSLISCFAINKIVADILYNKFKEQAVASVELMARTVATEMNEGNLRTAWEMIHLNVGKNHLEDFLLIDLNNSPVVDDPQAYANILRAANSSKAIYEEINTHTKVKEINKNSSLLLEFKYLNIGNQLNNYSFLFLFEDKEIQSAQSHTSFLVLSYFLFILFTVSLLTFFFRSKIHKAIKKVNSSLEDILNNKSIESEKSIFSEYIESKSTLETFASEFIEIKNKLELHVKEKTLADVAKQVAHDIRSPLSALNIITSTLADVPEEKRLLIRNSVQRINDIANDLLQKGKSASSSSAVDSNQNLLQASTEAGAKQAAGTSSGIINDSESAAQSKRPNTVFLVSTVVDNIISEKRIQFREKINVQINIDLKNAFGLFVKANPNELSRVISNLINNSVEALPNQSGNIEVSVFSSSDKKVCIQINDNGSGIPKHILAKLGQMGVTHGKDNSQSGSGLGVYHAMKTVQEFNGSIRFESTTKDDISMNPNSSEIKHTGTTITLEIPQADSPEWFAKVISLKSGQEFITVDDDISIHQIWKGRLESAKAKEKNIKITSFTSAKDFREYFNKHINSKITNLTSESKNQHSSKMNSSQTTRKLEFLSNNDFQSESNFVCLIDYEFLNQNDNGLKIIIDLNLQDKAILVTSRFDEPHIRSECESQKIKILPKQLAGQIPIHFQLEKADKFALCLIDDDKALVHSIWGMVAKEKELNIKMFATPQEFLFEAGQIDKNTPIYVDVSLGDKVNGVEFAEDIHNLGFENINLATGYDKDSIKAPSFIRQVVGKDFPL